jgi:hypothetical protein
MHYGDEKPDQNSTKKATKAPCLASVLHNSKSERYLNSPKSGKEEK